MIILFNCRSNNNVALFCKQCLCVDKRAGTRIGNIIQFSFPLVGANRPNPLERRFHLRASHLAALFLDLSKKLLRMACGMTIPQAQLKIIPKLNLCSQCRFPVKFPRGVVVSATPQIMESYADVPSRTCCTQTVRQVRLYTSSLSTISSACALQLVIKPTHFIWSVDFSSSVTPADFISFGIISSIRSLAVLSISFRCAVSTPWSISLFHSPLRWFLR